MGETMTVGQIIEKLKKFPSDLPAKFVYDSGCDCSIRDDCFAVKWIGGWVSDPHRYLLLNLHPEQHWGGSDTEQEQIEYVNGR